MRAVVIGAGVGGLAAAYELAKQGHEVHLVEASPGLGGQVRTFEVGGGRIENFYHHLFRSDTVVAALIEELGLGDDLEWIESRVGMLVGDRIFRFTGALDLLRFTPVSLLTRLRLGLSALWLRRVGDWERYEGQRAAEWITRAAGREGYERVWGPLLRAKFGRHAPDIAMPWFWSKIYLRFASREGGPLAKEQLGYLRGSFGRMVDALAAAIEERGGAVLPGRPCDASSSRTAARRAWSLNRPSRAASPICCPPTWCSRPSPHPSSRGSHRSWARSTGRSSTASTTSGRRC